MDSAELTGSNFRAFKRAGIATFAGGVLALLSAIYGTDTEPQDHGAFWALIAAQVPAALALALWRRPSLHVIRLSGWYGALIVSIVVAVAEPVNGAPLFIIWPLVIAAHALPRRDLLALTAATTVAMTVAIVFFVDVPLRGMLLLDTVLTVGFTMAVVRMLRERLDALVRELGVLAGQLRETARRDPLTGLPNRRAFDEALAREAARAARSGRDLAVVLFDLDHFKAVNDQHGHAAGDRALRRFAAVAIDEVRPGDLLARIGGEEFALTVSGADADGGREVAERIAARLRAATAGDDAPLTTSAGVAVLSPAAATPDAVLRAADAALYEAKAAGRRRVAVAGAEVGREVLPAGPAAVPAETALPEPADVPEVAPRGDERRAMQRMAVLLCLLGSAATVVRAVVPDPTPGEAAALLVIAAALAAEGLGLLALRRPPRWLLSAVPVVGMLAVTASVAVQHPITGTPFFYLWPGIYAAWFCSRRNLLLALATMWAGYGAVLVAYVSEPMRDALFMTSALPITVASAVVWMLRSRIRTSVEQVEATLRDLRTAASHDALTGLLNRRAFDAAFARELARARRTGAPLSLAIVDVDHFKAVNDRHGHEAGDAALQAVAAVLAEGRRGGDLVARLGGEEFALVLLDADAERAAALVEQLAERLRERTAGDPAPLSVSAGVAELRDELPTADALLLAADRALYDAKDAGRGRVHVAAVPALASGS